MGLLYTFCTVLGALDQRVKASSKETNDITRCAGAGKEGDGDPQVSGLAPHSGSKLRLGVWGQRGMGDPFWDRVVLKPL